MVGAAQSDDPPPRLDGVAALAGDAGQGRDRVEVVGDERQPAEGRGAGVRAGSWIRGPMTSSTQVPRSRKA